MSVRPVGPGPETTMIRGNLARAVGVLLAVAALLGGCESNETDTPEKTFNLLLTHVRNREFEKVWGLYTQSLREKNLREYAEFKARMQGLIDANDPNPLGIILAVEEAVEEPVPLERLAGRVAEVLEDIADGPVQLHDDAAGRAVHDDLA